jgi:PKD repeat protein
MESIYMKSFRFSRLLVLALATLASACSISDTQPPPLAGPSEMSLSLSISANPDVLSLDGASQSQIVVEARDSNGQPAANVPLRLEIVADGAQVDYGTLSARTLVTGSNGRTSFTYTAPMDVGGAIPNLEIFVTPTGTDASGHLRRVVSIRLVPPGVIAIGPTPRFTFSPANPQAFTSVRFDGSTSTAGVGSTITSYVWDFGDNTSGTGNIASHSYAASGTYYATLTVTDNNGLSTKSAAQAVPVGAGVPPTASFVFSPTTPEINQTVFFNGTSSTAGPGHKIVRYEWDFGAGSRRSGTDATVSKAYDDPGSYTVLLTVTDEVGQTGQATRIVSVGGGAPVASFTFSPTQPMVNQSVSFNAGASSPGSASSITTYAWNFGDGSSASGSAATRSHTYTNAGTYVVTLTITNSDGEKSTTTENVPVGDPQPTAVFTMSPTDPSAGQSVQFNGSSSTAPAGSTITSYVWDFGDGSPAGSGTNTSHTYVVAATYTVRLTVTDSSGKTATSTQTLTVD